MKRFISLTAVLCICLGLLGCGAENAKGGVVTTCFPLYDIASHLLGGDVSVSLLLKPGQDSHSYEPSPKDIVNIKSCSIFLCIGGQDESWVDTVLSGKDLSDVSTVKLIDHVPPIAVGEDHSDDDGHDHSHAYDEHIWTSPKNMAVMLDAVEQELTRIFPEHKEAIDKRAKEYRQQLLTLDSQLTEAVSGGERRTLIFGDRFPFLHLSADYGIEYDAAYPGCSDMTEPSAAVVAALISRVKAEGIPVVFRTQLSNGRVADSIAEQTGASVLVLHSLTNVTRDEWEARETYFSLMTKNIEAIKTALGEKK